jgi:flagellar hook-length control protein FliK
MQLSELVGQYNNASARPEMTGTKGVQKLVSTLRDMKSGNIFEGTVNSIKGQKVTLGLPNGQEVTARMDGKVSLNVGQSMFFQVKSNDGTQIAIRPYTVEGNSMNLTLMEALKTANIMVDGRNLSMVNSMMEEQMSISRDSLSQMARIVSNHPDIDVKTIVQLQKLDLPITTEMASQFENYQTDKQAIGQALENFMDALPDALANEELTAGQLQQTTGDVIRILTDGLPEEIDIPDALAQALTEAAEETPEAGVVMEAGEEMTEETAALANGETEADVTGMQGTDETVRAAEPGVVNTTEEAATQTGEPAPSVINEEFLQAELAEEPSFPAHTLGSMFDEQQMQALSESLKNFPELLSDETLSSGGQLRPTDSSAAVLNAVREQLSSGTLDKSDVLSLLSGKEFRTLLKDAMEQQWTIKPEELTQKDKVTSLYEKVENQLNRLEDVIRATGQQNENVTNLASDIRNNVQFMDQINQAYTYVQVPLQMSGQKASGELYVYTNKKNLAEGKEDLSAFLHLDMDHLGSTDVSVKMHGNNVSTNFYFDNDEAYALVQAHAPILEERLKAKGYNCTVSVANESRQVNFVDDFLKKDQPSAGMVHRYSFDMKA